MTTYYCLQSAMRVAWTAFKFHHKTSLCVIRQMVNKHLKIWKLSKVSEKKQEHL